MNESARSFAIGSAAGNPSPHSFVIESRRSSGRCGTNSKRVVLSSPGKPHRARAQNYHLSTPAEGKDYAIVWGCQLWNQELPKANAAQRDSLLPGQSGKLAVEFWITPFDCTC